MAEQYPIETIMEFLPQRYPFLMIDRVLEIIPKKSTKALKNVTINEPFFQGHFPGKPVMPGVMILEAMAQAGGLLVYESIPENMKQYFIMLVGIDKVRFRKPVVPGDQLIFELKVLKMKSKIIKMSGKAIVDGELVAEGELMASYGEKK